MITTTTKCVVCQEPVITFGKYKRMYCTPYCNHIAQQRKRNPLHIEERTCLNCEKTFSAKLGAGAGAGPARSKYCSKDCCTQYRAKYAYLRMRDYRERKKAGLIKHVSRHVEKLLEKQKIAAEKFKKLYDQYENMRNT